MSRDIAITRVKSPPPSAPAKQTDLEALAAAAVLDLEGVLSKLSQSEATRLRGRFESFTLGPHRSGPATIASVARGLAREGRRLLALPDNEHIVHQAGGNAIVAANPTNSTELLDLTRRPTSTGSDVEPEEPEYQPAPRTKRTARVQQGDVEAELWYDDAIDWRDNAGLRARYGGDLARFASARGAAARRVSKPAARPAQATSKPAKAKVRAHREPEPELEPEQMTAEQQRAFAAGTMRERLQSKWEHDANLRAAFGGHWPTFLAELRFQAEGVQFHGAPSSGIDAAAVVAALGDELEQVEEPLTPELQAEAEERGVQQARRDGRWEHDAQLRAAFGGRRDLYDLECEARDAGVIAR